MKNIFPILVTIFMVGLVCNSSDMVAEKAQFPEKRAYYRYVNGGEPLNQNNYLSEIVQRVIDDTMLNKIPWKTENRDSFYMAFGSRHIYDVNVELVETTGKNIEEAINSAFLQITRSGKQQNRYQNLNTFGYVLIKEVDGYKARIILTENHIEFDQIFSGKATMMKGGAVEYIISALGIFKKNGNIFICKIDSATYSVPEVIEWEPEVVEVSSDGRFVAKLEYVEYPSSDGKILHGFVFADSQHTPLAYKTTR